MHAPDPCPIDCPNRRRANEPAKWVVYGVAGFCFTLIVAFVFEVDAEGRWKSREDPPLGAIALCYGVACSSLGLQVPLEFLANLLKR